MSMISLRQKMFSDSLLNLVITNNLILSRRKKNGEKTIFINAGNYNNKCLVS